MIHRMAFVAALAVACLTAGASDGLPASTPRTGAQLERRMAELREQYAPYLRSLPKRMKVRSETMIEGPWRSRYEAENVRRDAKQAQAPDWFDEAFDDSAWAETTVPEWRYGKARGCILWYRTRFSAKPPSAGKRVFLVFAGVDWEAEVWLNGKRLGSHRVYYEPFRFDVTSVLKKDNVPAVRVITGPAYGEPVAFWSQFPFVRSKVLDGRDVLFGHRSFGMVSEHRSKGDLPAGMFLLNGGPCYLRGTNIHGLNALWYWDKNERIVDILLMLKAAHFNMVRVCQHVQYPEVRELQDRLGIMSQQDQGGGRGGSHDQYVAAAGALARICYNNPGWC